MIRKHFLQIYTDYNNSLGVYKIRHVLERDYGINISLGRVYRLMNTMNLPKRSTEKPKWKGDWKDNSSCVNHLNQQFNPTTPNSVRASDFTYIKVNGSFHYLCIVIDLFSRKVVGWSLPNCHDVALTIKAFEKAYFDRGEPDYVLFHSDQGSEYTAFTFRQILEKYNAVQSFSKKGYPYDNACCESFFRHMKRECIDRKSYLNQNELRLCCFEHINVTILNVLTLRLIITHQRNRGVLHGKTGVILSFLKIVFKKYVYSLDYAAFISLKFSSFPISNSKRLTFKPFNSVSSTFDIPAIV